MISSTLLFFSLTHTECCKSESIQTIRAITEISKLFRNDIFQKLVLKPFEKNSKSS